MKKITFLTFHTTSPCIHIYTVLVWHCCTICSLVQPEKKKKQQQTTKITNYSNQLQLSFLSFWLNRLSKQENISRPVFLTSLSMYGACRWTEGLWRQKECSPRWWKEPERLDWCRLPCASVSHWAVPKGKGEKDELSMWGPGRTPRQHDFSPISAAWNAYCVGGISTYA